VHGPGYPALTRQPRKVVFAGHAGTGFFEIWYFQEFCLSRLKFFSKYQPKIIKKEFQPRTPSLQGPSPSPYGGAPLPPTKVGAKCLATVALVNQTVTWHFAEGLVTV